ncbi:uncharacterized protein [Linepithema humile]|uniref:uncharacterized protein n=1 Tax=Linepithema humile TaxID=83485 RepID=UPI000623A52E|nr:PREDICTED: uncharacterized protein LOC105671066 [Linepithema humile]
MPFCCIVPDCKTGYIKSVYQNKIKKKLSLFRPRTDDMLLKWRQVICRPETKPLLKSHGVRELHFKEEDIERYYVTRLSNGSIFRMLKDVATGNTAIKSIDYRSIPTLSSGFIDRPWRVFGNEGDKGNRKRLLEFRGFEFSADTDELSVKMRQVSQQLGVGDLVSICNILAMDYTSTKQEVINRICSGLMDLSQLACDAEEEEFEHDDEEDDRSEGQNDDRSEKQDDIDHSIKQERKGQVMQQQVVLQPQHFSLSYKDVENVIRTFDDTDAYPVER